jgi:hypothetical protein
MSRVKEEIVEVMVTILNMIMLRRVPSVPSENEASRDGRGTQPDVETSAPCEVKDDRA